MDEDIRSDARNPESVNPEERFLQAMRHPLELARNMAQADIVIGIPFYNEADTLSRVIQTAARGLARYFPQSKSVIVAVGSPVGQQALQAITETSLEENSNPERIAFLLNDDLLSGKGWSTRAIMEIAAVLGADLLLLEADLKRSGRGPKAEGLVPDWISLLLDPVRQNRMDMVVSHFNLHYTELLLNGAFKYPLLSTLYSCPLHSMMGSLKGMRYDLVRRCVQAARRDWDAEIAGYGIDAWIITKAITGNARIGEARLGIKIRTHSGGKSELVFRQTAKTMINRIIADSDWWGTKGVIGNTLLTTPLPLVGVQRSHVPVPAEIKPDILIKKYREGFNQFHSLYQSVFSEAAFQSLENMAQTDAKEFSFPVRLWTELVYDFLLSYAFSATFMQDDLLDSLIPLRDGFIGGSAQGIQILKQALDTSVPESADRLIHFETLSQIEEVADEFLRQKPVFLARWEKEAEALKPPVPLITYREFIPGVPLIVPTKLRTPSGGQVDANNIYNTIFNQLKSEFETFVYERLGASRNATSEELNNVIKDSLRSAEENILPGADLSTVEGTEDVVRQIFEVFPHQEAFSLTQEMATWLLERNTPSALFTKLGIAWLDEALARYDPRDILAMASWAEEREYLEEVWALVKRNIRSEHFAPCAIKALVVSDQDFPALVEMRDSSDLDKLGSGILISSLHKGMGGEFPKLRYLTTIAKNIIEAERFGQVWKRFASDRKDFGRKVIDSIQGHWGREPLSAHNIFEDGIQRCVAQRLQQMAENLTATGKANHKAAEYLKAIADSYHLALTLPNGAFTTCSAWSWAVYSFHGGRASPPPLSIQVERDWTSHQFLIEYYRSMGGSEEEMNEKVIDLMGQGRASDDLGAILLGREKGIEAVIPREVFTSRAEQVPAGQIQRFSGNPLFEPIKEHAWESRYVLNAGAIWINDRVYLVYRAFGDDKVSRLGLAVSDDGFKFSERLDTPIFEPTSKNDVKGCEDPRLTRIGDRVYMTYTAYDGVVAQIAMASIPVDDFVNYRWRRWQRHGMVFPGFTDKDAALFPEQFNGKFAMLHRVDPHIWITFSTHIRCPWSRKVHEILAGSTHGLMWDGRKIGAGAQPIKTEYGWLLITHGVDYAHVYRLGVMVLDLANPSKLIYRSPNWVLEPEDTWEMGRDEQSWVPHVVFTCGAIPKDNTRQVLEAEDELIIYYGAADTVMCAGSARVSDLIPEKTKQ